MKIELKKIPGSGGERDILVDGVRWARTVKTSLGPQGYTVHVQDHHHHTVHKPMEIGSNRAIVWTIPSDKIAGRRARLGETVLPFEARLVNEVRKMIVAGELKAPVTLTREAGEREAERKRRNDERERVEQSEFEERATLALQVIGIDQPSPDQVTHVIEAMRWAQTR